MEEDNVQLEDRSGGMLSSILVSVFLAFHLNKCIHMIGIGLVLLSDG